MKYLEKELKSERDTSLQKVKGIIIMVHRPVAILSCSYTLDPDLQQQQESELTQSILYVHVVYLLFVSHIRTPCSSSN